MSLQDFSAEEVIIDKYVELKESKQDGDELIHELITKHFLPLWFLAMDSCVPCFSFPKEEIVND